MLKKVLIFILLGVVSLQGSPRELDQSEISLQGSLSFADILSEAKSQLGIRIKLPLKADEGARMEYNQVITLRQLAQAVVIHFAQDDVPLSWNYEAKELKFERKDLRPPSKKWVAKAPVKTTPPAPKRYPVPTIKSPGPELDYPEMPRWAQEKTVSRKVNETVTPIAELPTLSQKGIQTDQASWNLGRGQPSMGTSSKISPPTITRDQGAFEVKIPSPRPSAPRQASRLETYESPVSISSQRLLAELEGTSSTSTRGMADSGRNRNQATSWAPNSQPSSVGNSPSYRSPQTAPAQPRRGNFGITPYPEGAVAFINDAPSIVPGAAKEGFIEWATRLRGALREGNRMVLESEKEELERRLRWLKEHLR